jgi:hypothetical protein
MGFEIAEAEKRTLWVPVNFANAAKTVYQGAIVTKLTSSSVPAGEGFQAIGAASGHADTSHKYIPFGIAAGFNNSYNTETYSSTYGGMYGASVGSVALQTARKWVGAEGMWRKNDPQLLMNVELINPGTVLRGRLFNGAYGTVIPTYTATATDATGLTLTTAAVTFTPLAYNTTWYCVSGANQGLYRVAYSTSTTSHTFYIAWPYGITAGDTFRPAAVALGSCKAQFDSTSTYIEMSAVDYTSNDYVIDVLTIHLHRSGYEYVEFRFNADHFCAYRA